jgi:hypothetical protein
MKIANRMMIGSGIPSSQSNHPGPNPMTFSSADFVCQLTDAELLMEFRCTSHHCEERSDEAIQNQHWIASGLRPSQ